MPTLGHQFVEWSGALSGTNPVQSLTLDESRSVTATFEPIPEPPFALYLDIDDDGVLEEYTEAEPPEYVEYMRVADFRDNGRLIAVSPGDDDVQPIQFAFGDASLDEVTINITQGTGPQLKFYSGRNWWWWHVYPTYGLSHAAPFQASAAPLSFPISAAKLSGGMLYAVADDAFAGEETVEVTFTLSRDRSSQAIPVFAIEETK